MGQFNFVLTGSVVNGKIIIVFEAEKLQIVEVLLRLLKVLRLIPLDNGIFKLANPIQVAVDLL